MLCLANDESTSLHVRRGDGREREGQGMTTVQVRLVRRRIHACNMRRRIHACHLRRRIMHVI